jgi:hypothetical protein
MPVGPKRAKAIANVERHVGWDDIDQTVFDFPEKERADGSLGNLLGQLSANPRIRRSDGEPADLNHALPTFGQLSVQREDLVTIYEIRQHRKPYVTRLCVSGQKGTVLMRESINDVCRRATILADDA